MLDHCRVTPNIKFTNSCLYKAWMPSSSFFHETNSQKFTTFSFQLSPPSHADNYIFYCIPLIMQRHEGSTRTKKLLEIGNTLHVQLKATLARSITLIRRISLHYFLIPLQTMLRLHCTYADKYWHNVSV